MTNKVPKKILRIERNFFVNLRKSCFWPITPRRRRRFFWTGGAPPPPTEIDRRAAADTMTSAHSSSLIRSCIKSLPLGAAKAAVADFVTSRVDCCNSLLAGAPACLLDGLQSMLNAAARLICNRRKYVLHWLPVPFRIEYKLCLLVFLSLHGAAPEYRRDCCIGTRRGGDLGGLRDGPPKFEVGGRPMYRSPNILRSNVVGCARKYDKSKKGVIKELFCEI